MTHILSERRYPQNTKQRVEKTNYYYLRGLQELQQRRQHGCISPEEFNQIRSFSRQSWMSECEEQDPLTSRFQTTYSSFHQFRPESVKDGEQYRSKSRPSSPTRRNNPHPPRKCITLRIEEAPGFQYNNWTNQTLMPYKVGKRNEKEQIYSDKKVYYSTPTHDEVKKWEMRNIGKPELNISLHRWLKQAGMEEDEASKRLTQKLRKEFKVSPEVNAKYFGKLHPNRYVLGKY